MISNLGQIENLGKEIRSAENICEDDSALITFRVDQIGDSISRGIVVPEPEWYVGFNCTWGSSSGNNSNGGAQSNADKGNENAGDSGQCWQGLVDTITSLFGYSKQREQKSRAQDAINSIPSKVISSAEVLTLSRKICQEERTRSKAKDILKVAAEIHDQYWGVHKDVSLVMIDFQHKLETAQAPHMTRQVQSQTGVLTTLNALVAAKTESDLKQLVEVNRRELAHWEALAQRQGARCIETYSAWTIYARLIDEKAVQVDALRGTSLGSSESLTRFAENLDAGRARAVASLASPQQKTCQ